VEDHLVSRKNLSKAALAEQKQRLLQMRDELRLLSESDADSSRPIELDQSRLGRLSRMDAMQAQEVAQATARRRESRLVRIEGALRRLEAGSYGKCYVCSETIEQARLQTDPAVTRCVECQDDG